MAILCGGKALVLEMSSAETAFSVVIATDGGRAHSTGITSTYLGHGDPLPVAGLTQCMDHVVFHLSGGGRRHERL